MNSTHRASGAAIAASGVSRIYRGEHWLSDVAGGYLKGSALLAVAIAAREALGDGDRRNQ